MSRQNTFKRIRLTRKVCAICGEEKDISEFRLQWKNLDGSPKKEPHEDGCRKCSRAMMLKALDPDYVPPTDDGDNMGMVY